MKLKKKVKILFLFLLFGMLITLVYFLFFNKDKIVKEKEVTYYLSSKIRTLDLYDEEGNKTNSITRGKEVSLKLSDLNKELPLIPVKINSKTLYVNKDNLVKDRIDIVGEKEIYVKNQTTLYSDYEKGQINGVSNKGDKLEVVGYFNLLEDGSAEIYKIKKDDIESFIYSKYTSLELEEAQQNNEEFYNIHKDRKDIYSGVGGNAVNLDFSIKEKPKFENNVMPETVNAFYITSANFVIKGIDSYIEYAKKTNINAFVVDIKDNESSGYESNVFKELSPTNYKYANNTMEEYKGAITKLNEAGFYTIGRITVFKDPWFVRDNPDFAILDKRTNKPFDNGRWPSAYSRKVWEYTVSLAKEAVKEIGFNEIQFDYVRFPDRIVSQEKKGYLDFRNVYNEEKAQAIQRFLTYATDEIHKLNAYVAADVFGESSNKYVTAYGQYWPAISNVVDVICAMPYPDHFAVNSFGLAKPWENPYSVMFNWGKQAYARQLETPSPAIVRTWILAQNTMQGYAYNSEQISDQITALYDSKLTGGYMTWSSSGSLQGYKNRDSAYTKEY